MPRLEHSVIGRAKSVYGVPQPLANVIWAFPIVMAIVFGVLLAVPATTAWAHRLLLEDRLVENVTSATELLGGILGIALAIRLARRRAARWVVALFGVLGLLSIVVGAEEVSWGQRLFRLGATPLMEEMNSQKEDTLHNIHGFQPVNDWLPFTLGAIGLAAILLRTRRTRDASGVPSLLLTYCAVIVVLAAYDRFTDNWALNYQLDMIVLRLGEYVEMLVGCCSLIGFWLCGRRYARQWAREGVNA